MEIIGRMAGTFADQQIAHTCSDDWLRRRLRVTWHPLRCLNRRPWCGKQMPDAFNQIQQALLCTGRFLLQFDDQFGKKCYTL